MSFISDVERECMDRANAAEEELTALRTDLKAYRDLLLDRSKGVVIWRKEVSETLDTILDGGYAST